GAFSPGLKPGAVLLEEVRVYCQPEDLDLNSFAGRRLPMDLLIGKQRIERSQIVKQPDVIMALYLLWDRISPEARDANFRYYEPRTGHGSSLSPPIHAAVAARLGETEKAVKYFQQTCAIDLGETSSYAARGIHIGALGGLWQAAVMGFSGLSVSPEGVSLSPRLPAEWRRIVFAVRWHGRPQDFALETPPAVAKAPAVIPETVLAAPAAAVARQEPSERIRSGGVP